ncbi:hypothetical protein Poly30_16420 [Planctomycetes bacterium Poly30]|uniref:FG-GAP repeat protein n=1 Tax=Saltatorellus ferox TaxID=2528018 RepID=A0A518EPW6_9BACT|nr:hypothetical protein Poly30_16420 [Planctomycetes bacterium Poly30]
MALPRPTFFVAALAASMLPAAAFQDAHVHFGGAFADAPPLMLTGPGTAAAGLGSGAPAAVFSNVPGSPSALVPGLGGVEFEPGVLTNHFDRIYGHPSGHWVLTALADLPSARDECLIVSGQLVIQEGAPAPWIGGAENCGTIDTRCAVNASGDVAFATNTSGTVDDDFVATRIAGVWGHGAREGDTLPDGSGAVLDDTIDSSVLLDDGSVGYAADGLDGTATTDVDDDALVLGQQVLMRKGVTAPTGQLSGGSEFIESFDLGDFWTSGSGLRWLVQGDLEGPTSSDDVVIVNGAVVLQEGYPVPNSGFTEPIDTTGIAGVAMDAAGHWFARGDNDQTNVDWVVRDGDLVAVTGSVVVPGGTERWSDALLDGCFFGHVGNANGDYVVAGMTDHPDPALDAVIVLNNGEVVARESDPIDLDGNGLLDDGAFIDAFGDDDLYLSDARELYVVATLKDGLGQRIGQALLRFELRPTVGVAYCDVEPNSLGLQASLGAYGSSFAADNELTLLAGNLPPTANVLFMVSRTRGFIGQWWTSAGNLCLGASVARFAGPGEVLSAGSAGDACLHVDLNAIPSSSGAVAATAGDTFTFQCWYRDHDGLGATTTNLTNAVEVLFR